MIAGTALCRNPVSGWRSIDQAGRTGGIENIAVSSEFALSSEFADLSLFSCRTQLWF
ncbi:hypothetical protein ACPOL_5591 [Acidisarcina polymorpha]|uniref:Uncharacterized protein n=1 Tax=Acidisarcina polymorpha TaxID=2211140 RepID=A0A2Z5G780_9BACT|nr:hypothetical protein ACPOL_5591 [Acidisarcina polymorpha]